MRHAGAHNVPFRRLHLNHLPSKRGNSYIIALTDPFTKFLIVKTASNMKRQLQTP